MTSVSEFLTIDFATNGSEETSSRLPHSHTLSESGCFSDDKSSKVKPNPKSCIICYRSFADLDTHLKTHFDYSSGNNDLFKSLITMVAQHCKMAENDTLHEAISEIDKYIKILDTDLQYGSDFENSSDIDELFGNELDETEKVIVKEKLELNANETGKEIEEEKQELNANYRCPQLECTMDFINIDDLVNHTVFDHFDSDLRSCKLCSKMNASFSWRLTSEIDDHLSEKHGKKRIKWTPVKLDRSKKEHLRNLLLNVLDSCSDLNRKKLAELVAWTPLECDELDIEESE